MASHHTYIYIVEDSSKDRRRVGQRQDDGATRNTHMIGIVQYYDLLLLSEKDTWEKTLTSATAIAESFWIQKRPDPDYC